MFDKPIVLFEKSNKQMAYVYKEEAHLTRGESQQIKMIMIKGGFRKLGIYRYMDRFIEEYPEYKDYENAKRVKAVWNCDTSDEDIVRKFELLLLKLKKQAA
jgi:hypothetical protein